MQCSGFAYLADNQSSSLPQVGFSEIGLPQVGNPAFGCFKICFAEMGFTQDRLFQVRVLQIGFA